MLRTALVLEFFEHRPMGCPFCGNVCHCTLASPFPDSCPPPPSPLPPNANPANGSSPAPDHVLLGPDAYDASDERFSASSNASAATPANPVQPGSNPAGAYRNEQNVPTGSADDGFGAPTDPPCWKNQVAERLNRYRARRKPQPPRYPSLRLRFEAAEPKCENVKGTDEACPEPPLISESARPGSGSKPAPGETASPEVGRIIEFPRPYSALFPAFDELAEPAVEGPRIVEVPEVVPPAPALGGIILEPEETEPEKRPEFEIPLQAAPVPRRLLAGACDGLLVTLACAWFAYIFFKLVAFVPPLPQGLVVRVGMSGALWVGYQYLLLVYTGSTPGLRLARLRICRFDGTPVDRRTRFWRVLASILSAVSLGLGFAWCYLDEDALCWHDRITQTYLAPR
ncbi:MAG: hypothetical protein DMG69_17965 [Acidobacteria bacterium]|nr:MAG: hypothetical protein DMG69_17965 [Acidobacteriota bacterium]